MPEEKATRGASRYDAVIATLVGPCALCVSGYTAYVQRQQVPRCGPSSNSTAAMGHSVYPRQQKRSDRRLSGMSF